MTIDVPHQQDHAAIPADLDACALQVRAWLSEHGERHGWTRADGTAEEDEDEASRLDRARICQRLLHQAGYAGLTWPIEYGGAGCSNAHQVVFNREASAYRLPITPFIIGLGMCGPTLLAVGTEAQRHRHLGPLLSGDEIWCQMFSEPGAGSDVASLQTRAERTTGGWVLNGQKVWTSGAHHARFGLCLARSDPSLPKHAGLTMFVIDMTAQGLDVRPLRQMSGASHFDEVFLDDVVVGDGDVVGEVHGGWTAALATLMNERLSIGAGSPNTYGHDARELIDLARHAGSCDDPVVRQELARCWTDERIVRLLGQRTSDAILAGRQPGPEGSLAKLAGTALAKRSAGLAVRMWGAPALALGAGDRRGRQIVSVLLSSPGLSIAGGTDEVMRNIVAERVLGLAREPRWPSS